MKISIGKAAILLGVSKETIRRWEKKGKLISERTPEGHRRYDSNLLLGYSPKKPIMSAAFWGNLDSVRCLVEHGAKIDTKKPDMDEEELAFPQRRDRDPSKTVTVLDIARREHHPEIVAYLEQFQKNLK